MPAACSPRSPSAASSPSSSPSSSGSPAAWDAARAASAGPAAPHPPLDAFENYIKGLLAESPVSQASFLEAALRDAPTFDRARLALWEVRTEQADHAGGARRPCAPCAPTSPSAFHAQFFAGISLIELKRYDEALGVLQVVAGIRRPRHRRRSPPCSTTSASWCFAAARRRRRVRPPTT